MHVTAVFKKTLGYTLDGMGSCKSEAYWHHQSIFWVIMDGVRGSEIHVIETRDWLSNYYTPTPNTCNGIDESFAAQDELF